MREKHILSINEYFSDNVGDQAIALGVSEVFLSKGFFVKNAGFSRCRNKSANVGREKGGRRNFLISWLSSNAVLKSVYWFLTNGSRVFCASYKCEGIAFIGGGQLILENSSFAIAMFIWVLALKFFGNKVVLLAVGVGEDFGIYEKYLYKMSFAMADDIFVRERQGILRLKNEFNVEAKFCPDMAYALFAPKRPVSNHKTCAVYITSYDIYVRHALEMNQFTLTRDQYWEEWKQCVEDYMAHGYKIRFGWTTESDRHETNAFLKIFSPYEYSVFDKSLTLCNVMDDMSRSDVVVAGRMHALILAKISGCNVVPWLISKKIEVFSKEYLELDTEFLRQEIESVVTALVSRMLDKNSNYDA